MINVKFTRSEIRQINQIINYLKSTDPEFKLLGFTTLQALYNYGSSTELSKKLTSLVRISKDKKIGTLNGYMNLAANILEKADEKANPFSFESNEIFEEAFKKVCNYSNWEYPLIIFLTDLISFKGNFLSSINFEFVDDDE